MIRAWPEEPGNSRRQSFFLHTERERGQVSSHPGSTRLRTEFRATEMPGIPLSGPGGVTKGPYGLAVCRGNPKTFPMSPAAGQESRPPMGGSQHSECVLVAGCIPSGSTLNRIEVRCYRIATRHLPLETSK